MKFLVFKLYRYAVAQQETVPAVFGFVYIMAVFEGFHVLIVSLFLRIVYNPYFPDLGDSFTNAFSICFVTVIPAVNYLLFVKTGWIYRVDEHYSQKRISARKGNLIVFCYMVSIVITLFLQVDWYQDKYGNQNLGTAMP